MKIIRYVVAVIGFLLIWFVVAVIVGLVMAMLFPQSGKQIVMVGIGPNWRNIPGVILGFLAGRQSFRASMRDRRK